MTNCKVSIVVPSFNVGSYIEECMESLVNQTLDDIEIICIDAFSTDGTREVIEKYAMKDNRIRLLDDTARSTGFSKNLGFKEAKGEYVAIVEPDDYITTDMYEKLYDVAKEYDIDMVKGNYVAFLGTGPNRRFALKNVSLDPGKYNRVINPLEDVSAFSWDMYTWTGIYRKSMILDHEIWHQETRGAAFQDIGFWFQTLCYAKSVYLMKDYFYHYRNDNASASIHNTRAANNVVSEFSYIREKMAGKTAIWDKVKRMYVCRLFHDYDVAYDRLAEEYQPEFVTKFREDYLSCLEEYGYDPAYYDPELKHLSGLLLDSAQAYTTYKNDIEESRDENKQVLAEAAGKAKEIIIFGAGAYGMNLQILLEAMGYCDRVRCFCDNDPIKHGQSLNGMTILSPEEAKEKYPDGFFIVANNLHRKEITEQLKNMGIASERIFDEDIKKIMEVI